MCVKSHGVLWGHRKIGKLDLSSQCTSKGIGNNTTTTETFLSSAFQEKCMPSGLAKDAAKYLYSIQVTGLFKGDKQANQSANRKSILRNTLDIILLRGWVFMRLFNSYEFLFVSGREIQFSLFGKLTKIKKMKQSSKLTYIISIITLRFLSQNKIKSSYCSVSNFGHAQNSITIKIMFVSSQGT